MAVVRYPTSSFFVAVTCAVAALWGLPQHADARAAVSATITQCMLVLDRHANRCLRLTAGTALPAGTVIRYVIVAVNSGGETVFNLRPAGRIPLGTAYRPNSAVTGVTGALPRFSADGGKTWSRSASADGESNTIGWLDSAPLQAHRTATFRYDVIVK